MTSEASVRAAVDAALARFGRIDVLVNNAGFGVVGAIEETAAEDVRRVYETNVFGLLAVTRAVLPAMRARRAGHVINRSSVGGYRSGPGFGVYCSTKFAVEGLSEALHGELAHRADPPLRLPLGSDTVAAIEEKNAFVARELAAWRDVATSTDFVAGTTRTTPRSAGPR